MDPSLFGGEVVGCYRCGLLWSGRLVRKELKKQIEELTKRDPISKNMLHRGEWKSLGTEDFFHLQNVIKEAVLLREEIEREGEIESTRATESQRRDPEKICKESGPQRNLDGDRS
jgi:hypothetical protein